MITAKGFAGQSAIWHRATPTLEQFTRWSNRNLRWVNSPVHQTSPTRSAFIAEAAFEACAQSKGITTAVQEAAIKRLVELPDAEPEAKELTLPEIAEAIRLKEGLDRYIELHDADAPIFRPRFAGCGVVLEAEGDILIGSRLVEVKTVQRGFRGLDFRQSLTYAALAHSKGQRLRSITLINPRRGVYFESGVEGLALDIGAGSWVELMQDLVGQMSEGLSVSL